MNITDWTAFYQTLHINVEGYGRPVEKPTVAQLVNFELALGRKLPRSYREFLLVFGPGEFSVSLRIAAPGYSHALKMTYDLATASQEFGPSKEQIQKVSSQIDRERLSRLYYFGLESGRNWLGWDFEDVRIPGDHEYGIYRVEGVSEVSFVATTFRELIEATCEWLFAPNPDWDEEELGPQREFTPAAMAPSQT